MSIVKACCRITFIVLFLSVTYANAHPDNPASADNFPDSSMSEEKEMSGMLGEIIVSDREAQFFNPSRLRGESEEVEDIHFVPGNPFTFRAGVTYYLTGITDRLSL